ncbi:hypothetical protein ACWDKQ_32510 [Saccharopolyspora sp. NPDC000995]
MSNRILRGVASGEITLAFQRWPSPQVQAGSRLRAAVGLVGIGEVPEVDPGRITDIDAARGLYLRRGTTVLFGQGRPRRCLPPDAPLRRPRTRAATATGGLASA